MAITIRAVVVAAVLSPVLAFAQTPPVPKQPVAPEAEQMDAAACNQASDTHATVGKGGDMQVPAARGDNLSEKLAKSDGVICPPQRVDPEIHAPTPPSGSGSMPVIPPPGSPGGDQSVQPK